MRATASRTAAAFDARTVLSTTGRRPERTFGEQFLRRTEIQVLEDGPRLALDEPGPVALEDHTAVPEDPERQPRWRSVEQVGSLWLLKENTPRGSSTTTSILSADD